MKQEHHHLTEILPGVASPYVKVTLPFLTPGAGLGPEPVPLQGHEVDRRAGPPQIRSDPAGNPARSPQQAGPGSLFSNPGGAWSQPGGREGELWAEPPVPSQYRCPWWASGKGSPHVSMCARVCVGTGVCAHGVCGCMCVPSVQEEQRAGLRLAGQPGSWLTSPILGARREPGCPLASALAPGGWALGRQDALELAQKGANDQLALVAGPASRHWPQA